MKIIKLTRGYSCMVDDDDFEMLSTSSWHAAILETSVYAYAKRKQKKVSMHRLIMGAPEGIQVDHINGTHVGTILDNRKENLRLATHGLNKRNSIIAPKISKSGLLGVKYRPERNRWVAMVYPNGRAKWIGSFLTSKEAVRGIENWKTINEYRSKQALEEAAQ